MEKYTMGIYVCIWLIHFFVQQKLTQYCEAIILQLRSIKKRKKSQRRVHVEYESCSKLCPWQGTQVETAMIESLAQLSPALICKLSFMRVGLIQSLLCGFLLCSIYILTISNTGLNLASLVLSSLKQKTSREDTCLM